MASFTWTTSNFSRRSKCAQCRRGDSGSRRPLGRGKAAERGAQGTPHCLFSLRRTCRRRGWRTLRRVPDGSRGNSGGSERRGSPTVRGRARHADRWLSPCYRRRSPWGICHHRIGRLAGSWRFPASGPLTGSDKRPANVRSSRREGRHHRFAWRPASQPGRGQFLQHRCVRRETLRVTFFIVPNGVRVASLFRRRCNSR